MKRLGKTTWWLIIAALIISCRSTYVVSEKQYNQYEVSKDSASDASIEKIINPYRDSLSTKMDIVIGSAAKTLNKSQPESELGNFCADALFNYTKNNLYQVVDVSILNYGGLRLPAIPPGEITIGKIYELLPFENTIAIVTLSGDSLQKVCDMIAAKGGWPVSGLRFRIENNKAVDLMINNEKLISTKSYKIVAPDYIANGGDNMSVMKSAVQNNTGWLLRDAMIDYIRNLGKPIDANLDNRITK